MNKYKQVNVRFSQPSLCQQRIRFSDYTGANYLKVVTDGNYLSIMYVFKTMNDEEVPIKTLLFNHNFVVEIECEEVVS